jgi:anti-sigma factor RsiW
MKEQFDNFENNSLSDMCQDQMTLENDRFELLSAYIDGEVTVAQKEQVQQWLNEDSNFQQLYQRLLKLNQGFQSLPTPVATQSPQQITNTVFAKMEQHRWQRITFWGGTAIAALAVGVISVLLPENRTPVPKMAETPVKVETTTPIASNEVEGASLMIAVNRPVVPIPKAPEPPSQDWEKP